MTDAAPAPDRDKLLADGYKHVLVWGGIVNWPFARESAAK